MVSEFQNAWNYAQGAKKGQKKINPPAPARATADALFAVKPLEGKAKADCEMRDMVSMVEEILEVLPSAVSNVKGDWKTGRVTYRVRSSDYLEQIEEEALKAGFRPSQEEDVVET